MNTLLSRLSHTPVNTSRSIWNILALSTLLAFGASMGHAEDQKDTTQKSDTQKSDAKANIIAAKSRISAPDFELDDTEGELVVLSELKGKVVVIVFWATWCEPCKQEIPFLSEMRKNYKSRGFEVLTISTDNAQTQSRVEHYARKWNTRTMIDTDGEVKTLLNPRGFAPYTLVIDREGLIAFKYQGYQAGDEKMIDKVIKILLADEKK